ncbi:MAG: hypothetical protein CM1200mP36_01890 [Gammaproteobacteria bacterium]|nr:MAG: hypothetical protein CM1200mP36_01890 [Gammaproteobacteria bacterium]
MSSGEDKHVFEDAMRDVTPLEHEERVQERKRPRARARQTRAARKEVCGRVSRAHLPNVTPSSNSATRPPIGIRAFPIALFSSSAEDASVSKPRRISTGSPPLRQRWCCGIYRGISRPWARLRADHPRQRAPLRPRGSSSQDASAALAGSVGRRIGLRYCTSSGRWLGRRLRAAATTPITAIARGGIQPKLSSII